MSTRPTLLSFYTIGGALASTAAAQAAIVHTFAGPSGFLAGDGTSQEVDRGRISFDVNALTVNYSREFSDAPTATGALSVSPNYEFKPVIGQPVERDGEARGPLLGAYQAVNASLGDPIDGGQSFGSPTALDVTSLGYLGISFFDIGTFSTYYGWLSYAYNGNDVTVKAAAFESDAGQTIIVGAIPESSTTMAIIGAVCAGGLFGIRKLRQKKAAPSAAA